QNVNGPSQMRALGAVSALAAARDAIFTMQTAAAGSNGTATSRAFTNAAAVALPVIDAAVGGRTAAIPPSLTSVTVNDSCTEWGNTKAGNCSVEAMTTTNGSPAWLVTVQTTSTDPYTQLLFVPGNLTSMIASAALDPNFVAYDGATMASLIAPG